MNRYDRDNHGTNFRELHYTAFVNNLSLRMKFKFKSCFCIEILTLFELSFCAQILLYDFKSHKYNYTQLTHKIIGFFQVLIIWIFGNRSVQYFLVFFYKLAKFS